MPIRSCLSRLAALMLLSGASMAGERALQEVGGGEQLEADYRVIAARCGSPAFEKTFTAQSRRLVAAGLIAPGRDPVVAEKTVTALRRSPMVLVAVSWNCTAQLVELTRVQKARASLSPSGKTSAAR